ncbi:MAG: beta-N-acetylhexosaminidase [Acidobacteria bacterium]|nr:beta-N-acetylhexosaminidase [Acidobacteriota bacterium]
MWLRDFRRHVGRLAIVGFTGESVPDSLRELARAFDLGGVVYFRRNVRDPLQLAELSREVAALAGDWPLWIAVDQEGGRVARLTAPFTEWPPARVLGHSGDETLARRFAQALAAELDAVGINLDFAPVLDVLTNPANPVVGDRAISDRADDVARLGAVVIRTLQEAGIAACGKHFPGHGDASVDSHEALPVVEHDRRRLDAVELVPFRRAIAEDVAAIMTAHLLMPAFDERRPATLSSRLISGLLKRDLGFGGLVMTDDLGMKAVTAEMPGPEAAVSAIEAGCDVVLLCNAPVDEQVAALEALIYAAESGRLTTDRVDDAFGRQARAKTRFLAPARRARAGLDRVGALEHQTIARDMAAWR